MTRHPARRVLLCALAAAALVPTMPVRAASLSCAFAISDLNFGTVDLTQNTAFDSTATLTINCSGDAGLAVRVCPNINAGAGGTATGSPRFMTSGGNSLAFDLYQDASHSVVWGSYLWAYSGSYPAPTIDFTLNAGGSMITSVTIYGRVAAGQQALPTGSYASSFGGSATQIAYAPASTGSCPVIGNTNATAAAFTVSANYAATCGISATTLDFGSHGVLASAVDGASSLRATCSAATPYTIGLSGGNAAASDPTQRKMANGGNQITYGLYRDAARAQPWGDAIGTNTASGTGSGSAQTFAVYGRIPAQVTPAPGTYSDTIIATLTY